ncbi:hypothetical protein MIDIC_240012 [Alphaproteobacteria bacterium]
MNSKKNLYKMDFFITKSAAHRIKELAEEKLVAAKMKSIERGHHADLGDAMQPTVASSRFRVQIVSGGCSGLQYKYGLDDNYNPESDIIIHQHQVEVVIDRTSLKLLDNSTLHYTDELGGTYFHIQNPNEKAKCGCGKSFSAV